MFRLTIADLRLGLIDLLANRRQHLQCCASGRLYEPLLAEQLKSIRALPPTVISQQLSGPHTADLERLYLSLYLQGEWFDCDQPADPLILAATKQVRESLAPDLPHLLVGSSDALSAHLQKSVEAVEAARHRGCGSLVEQVMMPNELTTESTEHAGTALVEVHSCPEEAHKILGATTNLLMRMRQGLREELATNTHLPADLEDQIFAYFDRLDQAHENLA